MRKMSLIYARPHDTHSYPACFLGVSNKKTKLLYSDLVSIINTKLSNMILIFKLFLICSYLQYKEENKECKLNLKVMT